MGVDIQVSSRYLDRVTRLIAQGLPVEIFRPGHRGGAGPPLPRQGDRHRQHDRPDDLHLPDPGRGRQPGEVAPARRVREGRRQGRRGQGRGRRPRAGRGRDPGRPDGLHRRRAGQGDRRPRPGDLHLRGPPRHRIGPGARPAGDRRGAPAGPHRDDGQDRAGLARRAACRAGPGRHGRETPTSGEAAAAGPRRREPRPRRASQTDVDPRATGREHSHGQLLHRPADLRHGAGPADAARRRHLRLRPADLALPRHRAAAGPGHDDLHRGRRRRPSPTPSRRRSSSRSTASRGRSTSTPTARPTAWPTSSPRSTSATTRTSPPSTSRTRSRRPRRACRPRSSSTG